MLEWAFLAQGIQIQNILRCSDSQKKERKRKRKRKKKKKTIKNHVYWPNTTVPLCPSISTSE